MPAVPDSLHAAPDRAHFWPGITAILIALFVTCGYGSGMDLAYFAGWAAAAAGVLCGGLYLMRRRPRAAASWLMPWAAYIVLMLPLAYPARIAMFDAGNFVRFASHRHDFEKQARQLHDASIDHTLWRLGIQGADEIYLLYDVTDDRALADRLLNKLGACFTRSKTVKTHFQIVTVSC